MADRVQFVLGVSDAPRPVLVDCTIRVPMEDGSFQDQQLKVSCLMLSETETGKFFEPGAGGDKAMCDKIVQGFPDLKDADGKAHDFEPTKASLLAFQYVRLGIIASYVNHRAGLVEKN